MRALLLAVALLAGCPTTPPPAPPGDGVGGGGTHDGDDTTDCYTCELDGCSEEGDTGGVSSESDCSDRADELGCEGYSWDPC